MANVYSLDGKVSGKIELPKVFKTDYRPDLIQRAVVTLDANERQVYGHDVEAGLRSSADYYAVRRHTYRLTINRGISRLPREKPGGGGLGRVRIVPQSRGGRRAHGPNKKSWHKKINKKEYLLALKSAIAAASNKDLIAKRGHSIGNVKEIPLIVEDSFNELNKTKDVVNTLRILGLEDELKRSKEKKTKAGRGKTRGRKYRTRKSLLIVLDKESNVKSAADNIPGVDVTTVDTLDVGLLAPGTLPGRLTLWTKSAIKNIDKI